MHSNMLLVKNSTALKIIAYIILRVQSIFSAIKEKLINQTFNINININKKYTKEKNV